jgi:ketopantoate reductase
VDGTITELCAALRASRFTSEPDERAMELKYRKLILNLGNGVEVITHRQAWGASGELGAFMEQVRAEAMRCYQAAGITSTSPEEYARRVTAHYSAQPVGGEARAASSTWQSVLRGHPTVEVDYLNGEIELLGALYDVPTPFNSLIRREAVRAAAAGADAVPLTLAELRQMAEEAAGG